MATPATDSPFGNERKFKPATNALCPTETKSRKLDWVKNGVKTPIIAN